MRGAWKIPPGEAPESDKIYFRYRFTLPGQDPKEFEIGLDRLTLSLQPLAPAKLPQWTALSYAQCVNCPLSPREHPRCPMAVNLVEVLEFFRHSISYTLVDLEIITETRTYVRKTPLQYGLSSLIGLIMATSGCPVMDKLRPMARLHLPFSSLEETHYRVISMYLTAQYLRARKKLDADWDLRKLPKIYQEVQTVNRCFHERLSELDLQDAGLNALFQLDAFAHFTNMHLLEQDVEELQRIFGPYMENP